MGLWLQKLVHLLRLARLTLALTAVSNCWLMVFLGVYLEPVIGGGHRVSPELMAWPLVVSLLILATVAIGLHSYGMALNDMLDARHDRLFAPHRPLAAGRISVRSAVAVAVLALLAALLATVFLDRNAILLCLSAAAVILFFNAMGKYLPAYGILALGLVRVLIMFLANPPAGFLWPVWLTMTHVMLCWAVAYRIEGKRPRFEALEAWTLCAGWIFFSMLLLGWMRYRGALVVPDRPGLWIGPLVAEIVFVIVALNVLRRGEIGHRRRRETGAAFLRLGLLWLIVNDMGWLLGAGLYWPALAHGAILMLALLSLRLKAVVDDLEAPPVSFRLK